MFTIAAFSFAGTELVGLAASEAENPRKSLPSAIKQVFWRICLFYIVALLIVGLIVPYNNSALLDGTSSADAKASPFVLALVSAQIHGLPSVMNVVIMIAVLSVGNSSVYGSSRTIAALADQGQAPRIFGYIDRRGRPIVAIGLACAFGFLAFLAGTSAQTAIFNWLLSLSGLSSIFTWGSICFAHIRFRKAWALAGNTLDDLPFRSWSGVTGSWIGFIINVLVLMAQFWVGIWPVGYGKLSMADQAESFFEGGYLAAVVVLVCFIGYKLWYRTSIVKTSEMDIKTGRRELDIAQLLAEERAAQRAWPRWKKVCDI